MSSPVRLRRLMADYKRFTEAFKDHPRISIRSVFGNPPEKYELEYKVKSLVSRGGNIEIKDSHVVEICLPLGYPRQAPVCRMLTPVFHPNIAPHAICIGDHWAAGEALVHLVVRIGEMLAYQSYNIKSPLNGEAARWADTHRGQLPTDPADLSPKVRPEEVSVDGQAASTALPVAKVIPVARAVPVAAPGTVQPAAPATAVPGIPVARAVPVARPEAPAAPAPSPARVAAAGGLVRATCSSCGRSRILPGNSPAAAQTRCVYCGGPVTVAPAG
ncbi:MAG TPA: ubiquitin-conjugating enzyme E2 [Planctomycetota bacterium]|nr:ubiquitin-conjugating enzyme E2 [Planctomycetota bacterium]